MNKWITTGQMIDELRIGEIAESSKIITYGQDTKTIKVERSRDGSIRVSNVRNPYLTLDKVVMGLKWQITPNYVSFEEAMRVLRDGGYPTFHDNNGDSYSIGLDGSMDWASQSTWRKLAEGKWTVED